MKSFWLAWRFLTLLPVGKSQEEIHPRYFGQSMAYYPLVGFLLGLLLWGAHRALAGVFPRALADGVTILFLVVLTAAFHLDGLADMLDGLAFGKTPPERLQIMRDHRVGTFGVVGLILILGVKFLALNALPQEAAGRALCLALLLGRWSMVQMTYRAPYARSGGGLGSAFKEHLGKREVILAGMTSLICSFFLFSFWGVLIGLAVVVGTLGIQAFFQKKIGGFTGDILGGTNEINEVFSLLAMAGILHFLG
jgi:adenosylcobinamide-GDP ribazoletransferase